MIRNIAFPLGGYKNRENYQPKVSMNLHLKIHLIKKWAYNFTISWAYFYKMD